MRVKELKQFDDADVFRNPSDCPVDGIETTARFATASPRLVQE
jgi:hypothetical protein